MCLLIYLKTLKTHNNYLIMNKIILLILLFVGCGENTPVQEHKECNKWIIESKSYPVYMVGYTFQLSNIETMRIRTLEVGKYTFYHYNPGDTLVLNK